MNMLMKINEFKIENILFNDSIKNTVLKDSNFIKILYSNQFFLMNSLYFNIKINKNNYFSIINDIINIEKNILNLFNQNIDHKYNLKEKLINIINYFEKTKYNNIEYIIKISGIWKNEYNMGITFKIININHQCKKISN